MKTKLICTALAVLAFSSMANAAKVCEFNDPSTGTTPGCTQNSVSGGGGTIAYQVKKNGYHLLYVSKTTEWWNNNTCVIAASGQSNYTVSGNCNNYRVYGEEPGPTPQPVTLSGTVTYDRVPVTSNVGGFYLSNVRLNYANTQAQPVRGARVVIKGDGADKTVATNDQGIYSAVVNSGANISIEVYAELSLPGGSVQVRDNTGGDALYRTVTSSEVVNQNSNTRNIHLSSGWNATAGAYTSPRAAAPFAILDSIYESTSKIIEAKPSVSFPALDVFWSPDNVSSNSFNHSSGLIRTSHFNPGNNTLYILGDEDVDTDEYDASVVVHEFFHYVIHNLFRASSSPGGQHDFSHRQDLRLAFNEGAATGFSGIVLDHDRYEDTNGAGQNAGGGFSFVAQGSTQTDGWYREAAVANLLYQSFDDQPNSYDSLSLDFATIFNSLSGSQFVNSSSLASIYSYLEAIRIARPELTNAINNLAGAYGVFGTGWFGDGETNSGGNGLYLPVYRNLNFGGTVNVCSRDDNGTPNRLGNYGFIRADIPAGTHTITVSRTSGNVGNPSIRIYQRDVYIAYDNSSTGTTEVLTRSFADDVYVIAVAHENNVSGTLSGRGNSCFNVTIN